MDDFPAIRSDQRSYELPQMPASMVTSQAGRRTPFRHGRWTTGAPIPLSFTSITTAEKEAILAHYRLAKGHSGFMIPIEVWATHDSPYDVTPFVQKYRYDGPPSIEPNGSGLWNVALTLRTFF